MTTLAPAPSSFAPPVHARPETEASTPVEGRPTSFDGLPLSSGDAPVRLALRPFPVLVAWIREDTWSVTEVIGGSQVVHGHLRVVGPRFAMAAAGGTRPPHRDWRTAVLRHLGAH